MRPLVWNLFLAGTWAFAVDNFSIVNLCIGFALGYLAIGLVEQAGSSYHKKVHQIIAFALYFLWELILANLRVAHDVLTPRLRMRPGVVAIPLDVQTPEEILLLATVITLTPGSVALDVSDDRKTLYVHVMFIQDVDQTRERIKQGLERRVLEVMR
jgi:multicomponent Na+:H+ antiporter subunit E